ncbi:MAG TPA: UbiH/UbiF family hydroxylase [Methylophilaceae bacterium]
MDRQEFQQYDVIVVGAGLVGMSCALALSRLGISVALVEARPMNEAAPPTTDRDWDARIYAISPANADWLAALGVWPRMPAERICPIARMQVFGDATDSSLQFDAHEACVDYLGYILESRQLEHALQSALKDAGVRLVMGVMPAIAVFHERRAELRLTDGSRYQAQLLVAADGANSWLRAQAGIAVQTHDFRQLGVVANFAIEQPHRQTAFQWFCDRGILAWLPLPGNRMSMVWSTDEPQALLELAPEMLSEQVARQGGCRLGALQCLTPAQAFPLRQMTAVTSIGPLLALVGDAAHTVHPLAGQGVNLGFEDVRVLVETLAARRPLQMLGDRMLLRRYERARKGEVREMQCVTRGLNALFAHTDPRMRQLRNWGLRQTDRQARLKQYLIHQAIR